jgi:predicted nucleotidyltransferase
MMRHGIEFELGALVGLKFFQIERELSEMIGREVDRSTPGFLGRRCRDRVLSEAEVQ